MTDLNRSGDVLRPDPVVEGLDKANEARSLAAHSQGNSRNPNRNEVANRHLASNNRSGARQATPARGVPPAVGQQLFRGLTFTEPDDVIALGDGMTLRLAGVELVVDHAPGHTPGSVTFRSAEQVMFSGDVLFAGSIGRTDLPGGDYPAMLDTLSRVCLTLPDDTLVLPGHGPRTTIGAERATNPFLAGLSPGPESPARPGPTPPAPATGPKRPGL